ncbi:MAG: BrnA antitoxin family protein [Beijerinckiaceae bacterium]
MDSSKVVRAIMLEGELYEQLDNGTLKPLKGETDWKRLDAMTDAEVTAAAEADPDSRPMTDDDWAQATLVIPPKVAVGMRLDADVLAWFKQRGAGYQTRINAVLRRYMEAQG